MNFPDYLIGACRMQSQEDFWRPLRHGPCPPGTYRCAVCGPLPESDFDRSGAGMVNRRCRKCIAENRHPVSYNRSRGKNTTLEYRAEMAKLRKLMKPQKRRRVWTESN